MGIGAAMMKEPKPEEREKTWEQCILEDIAGRPVVEEALETLDLGAEHAVEESTEPVDFHDVVGYGDLL